MSHTALDIKHETVVPTHEQPTGPIIIHRAQQQFNSLYQIIVYLHYHNHHDCLLVTPNSENLMCYFRKVMARGQDDIFVK